ncbi:hypothetical protein GCM10029964_111980 [Kibdelosporangium lantanae]
MRRRILMSILLAVAVTTCALGIPLGYTALQLVETLTREDLQSRVQQIGVQLDSDIGAHRAPDISKLQPGVQANDRLVVTIPGRPVEVLGPDPGPDPLAEQIQVVDSGSVVLEIPSAPTRARQTQVAGLVVLTIVLTIAVASGVAIVTANRLARPSGTWPTERPDWEPATSARTASATTCPNSTAWPRPWTRPRARWPSSCNGNVSSSVTCRTSCEVA